MGYGIEYQVERGYVAPAQQKGGARTKYPWAGMEVDESFFVPCLANDSQFRTRANVPTAAKAWVRYHENDWKFTTQIRNDTDHGEEGVRIWRVK